MHINTERWQMLCGYNIHTDIFTSIIQEIKFINFSTFETVSSGS